MTKGRTVFVAVVSVAIVGAGIVLSEFLSERSERAAARQRQEAYFRKTETLKQSLPADAAAADAKIRMGALDEAESLLAKYAELKDSPLPQLRSSISAARKARRDEATLADAQKYLEEGNAEAAASAIAPLLLDKHPGAQSLYAKIEPAVARERAKAAAAERARLKSQGVRIGMTADQVLVSSWGRPERVNTTTTARGSREQWVYRGSNFLYFENGILTAIQN